ncbi:MAG: hypothetical protein IKP78_01450 [Ruminococcus sp.]|nr:hypothetical protein [Ruminococcus sp.]
MFGNREMIDESSCNVIDEMDYDVVDDIRDEKRRGASHAGHLCEEGQYHETVDRQASAAYNTTPRTSSYPKPAQQTPPRNTSPYPKPQMKQYTPQAAPRQERPVQSTIFNGRTYDRPAETPTLSPAQQKANRAFVVLMIVGIAGSCVSSFLLLPVCVVLGIMIQGAVRKCEGDDVAPVNRMIAVSVCIVIFAFVFIIAGKLSISMLQDLLTETGDLGGY